MAKSCSIRDESGSVPGVRVLETGCEEERVSALASWFVSCARRKSKRMSISSFSFRIHSGRVTLRLGCVYSGAAVFVLLITSMQMARAGGPRYIAGISYFNQGTAGTPLTWAQGEIDYYTDQGSLSPTVSGPQGDALVADAFSQWTSISTAAVSATRAG